MRISFLIFCLSASPMYAACPLETDTFLSCTIANRHHGLDVCIDGDQVSYAYGLPKQPPELSLVSEIATLEYQPWPGVGRSIWEEVTFHNGNYSYTVSAGFDRTATEGVTIPPSAYFGGVVVHRAGDELTSLMCQRETVVFPWTEALGQGKHRAGLRWDMETQSWTSRD